MNAAVCKHHASTVSKVTLMGTAPPTQTAEMLMAGYLDETRIQGRWFKDEKAKGESYVLMMSS